MSTSEVAKSAMSVALDETAPGNDTTAGEDHALAVLLAVRAQIAPDLPESLLRQCYAIQKQFQFDRDEQLPIVHTRRLVEGYVEHETEPGSDEPGKGDA
jgi:hypothetical protein